MDRRSFIKNTSVLSLAGLTSGLSLSALAANPPEVRLDYAYYSPTSLVLKKFGWLEEALKPANIPVKWTLSQGSNRALEYLAANSIDFGSTAGLAAVLSHANGNPIKSIDVYSRPDGTALLVTKDSPIQSVAQLKGKKIAATKGTDPYLFLLRTLKLNGLRKNDVEIVHLQHADGRTALESGRVDAWAGLDPHMAASELQANTRLLYRNVAFNTYGFLNVTEDFAKKYPDTVKQVIAAYERARLWILANPKEASQIQADEAKISLAVAKVQLNRTDFSNPVIGREHSDALKAAAPILLQEDLVKRGTDVNKVIDELIDPRFVQGIVVKKAV
ncbi:MAG: aliphatic sulfonate ABC transporter substrate-binding protein [Oxalicibacterium faecigallinarum]|uniref:aliphatic sulfonate ABC transporter substrate-binding protein n=1 Tax=Oxalicibacterium faecigallinarum TaxID=573741 RepID=UPI002809214B|nr:aliphatic sulfonate ABC transporter substrate-binding protein [Oxalicibacterium faecigallinarum]MDQ7968232.1 aliphatic sulfonate ABC transporter substrate-binding protein [Oxalicibacterium faecigallinarum]